MKSETKVCQNCKQDFRIEPDDFGFYEKIQVPPPTLCPECRQQRRYAWRNERTLYRRNCDLCGSSMVTIYSPTKPFKVYCLKCWWGDGWDFTEYGRDFDFSRSFFEQFSELQHDVPRLALLNKNSVKSDYTNHSGDNKNVFLSFSCFTDEDVFYSTFVMKSRSCVDCSYVYEAGEKLYECIDSHKSYQCQFGFILENCVKCLYCYDCRGSSDCFMSSNLRSKNYVFMNQQLSKEEYFERLKQYDLSSHSVREFLYQEFLKLMRENSIHKYAASERNANSIGNMIFNCKNARACFDLEMAEDAKYFYSGLHIKTAMDNYHVGMNSEVVYENHGCTRLYNCQFCHLCYDDSHVMYSDTCQNSQNLFGCVCVQKGEYMIFNKKYSKEEYTELKERIIAHMKQTGEYGEFFPPSIAPVYYNETQGQYYLPLVKEEVLARGWHWEDQVPGTFGKETLLPGAIPDQISQVEDAIVGEILRCESCAKNYNIISDELTFYRQENIPIPHKCADCRYKDRFAIRLPRKLWQGVCKCDLSQHGHEGRCPNEFETPYAPERPEKVFCEHCYQQEIV